jgi:diguanylate cyclase (GGDEF)-like protein/PAS domain S-box-containing protein
MPYQAEAILSALIESTDDFVWSVDLNFGLLTFNRAMRQNFEINFGKKPGVGMRPEELLPAELAANWPPLYKRALSEGPIRVEYPFNVSGRMLELTLAPIRVHGKPVGVSVFGKDVTEKRAAEKALLEAERKNRAVFDSALEGMVQTTPEGKCLAANPALARMLGYDSPEELTTVVTDSANDVWFKPQERARFVRLLETQGTVRGFECRQKRKDGSIVWVSLNAQKVCRADGRTLYYESFIEEITERKRAHMQLRDSEERYRATFDQAAIGIVHVAFDDARILRCNPRFAEIIGYSLEEVPGMSLRDLTPVEHRTDTMKYIQRVKKGAVDTTGWEKPYLRKDGSLTWVKITSSIQRDGAGRPLHLVIFVEDINRRKATEDRLDKAMKALTVSESRYRTAFQTSLDGIAISTLSDGRFIDVNKAFLEILGFEREEFIGRTSLELNCFPDLQDRGNLVDRLRQNPSFQNVEVRYRKKTGETIWVLLSCSVIEIEGVQCILSVMRDISDAKNAVETIRDLAFFDPLTRLPNRRALLDSLRQAPHADAHSPRTRALLFIDLDDFKTLNDSLGNRVGDLFLQEIARRLTACVGHADTVARFSGDEFAVILEYLGNTPEEAAAHAKTVAEKVLAAVRQPCVIADHTCRSGASIGIALFDEAGESVDEVVQQANIAMHQAKSAGRNAIRFFAPALQAAVNARAAMEKDLHHAIETNQFQLYYQHQVDSTGMIGAEALIRWHHPTRGLLTPHEFIPLAEETGLILAIGGLVLESACTQIASWAMRKESAHTQVAVNVSARQFRQPDFVERLLAVLDRTGANPENLKLELTESMLADDIDHLIAQMIILKSHGLKFSLDDFGTGYSSLSNLKRLPLDQLKIDRTFVRDIQVDVASGAIAETIISLGRAMGLSVIAEGVETEDQRQFLANLGCQQFQGFLFSHPLPLDEFERSPLFRGAALNSAAS